jgi:hypothetical protein
LRADRIACINHFQHEISINNRSLCALNPQTLNRIRCLSQTSRICQEDWDSLEVNGFGQRVARCARNVCYDGAVARDQPIEQTRLADVRATNNRDLDSRLQQST